ncbi:hypothetical protein [Streptomyces sp. NPDC006879]|uniref:hypothetical protein n=1 Tax=Streptomyces sp. NPDC006879 TaxID=3364767 RepID=UPI00369D12C9
MRIGNFFKSALAPLSLLLTAVTGGSAHASNGDFQYFGQDDKVHAVQDFDGCTRFMPGGGGGQPVVNHTGHALLLFADHSCQGRPVAMVGAGRSAQVQPFFGSARATV